MKQTTESWRLRTIAWSLLVIGLWVIGVVLFDAIFVPPTLFHRNGLLQIGSIMILTIGSGLFTFGGVLLARRPRTARLFLWMYLISFAVCMAAAILAAFWKYL